jgi:cytochrome c-type biogenesis protein CcmF
VIIELGHFALVFALLLTLPMAAVPLWGALKGRDGWMRFARPAAISISGLVTIAFFALVHAYALSDFSVRMVVENSHTMKPVIYKIAAVWGNHEGSMLLWALILALWTARLARAKDIPLALQARALGVAALLQTGFLSFILFASSPFQRLDPPPKEGLDLNPILQDVLLAIHPPVLYMGYVGFAIAFCFAAAALIEKKADSHWAGILRPYAMTAWIFLTCGIALGSFWAYYELGWGGFWFWDPVENASLLPWLAGTALLHSVAVLEKRGSLRGWTVFLAILAFSLSLTGTFLVRSGILTSVHAFASDPLRGVFILALLGLMTGGALLLYAFRAPYLKMAGGFRPVSRESALLLNNVFLFTVLATVFTGTVYPVILSALDLGTVTVGPPYYTLCLTPLLVPFALLMGVGPNLAWREAHLAPVLKKLAVPVVLAAGLAVLPGFLRSEFQPAATALIFAAGCIGAATLQELFSKTNRFRHFRLPASFYGMVLAHLGFAFMLAGATAATSWKSEETLWMKPQQVLAFAGYDITFRGVQAGLGKNFDFDRAQLTVASEGLALGTLAPEKRWYPGAQRATTETGLLRDGLGIVYATLGDTDEKDPLRRVLRFYFHPFILLLPFGVMLIALGGAVALLRRKGGNHGA